MKIPFIAFGNEELKDKPFIGKRVYCRNCQKQHRVKFGDEIKDGKKIPDKTLGFVNCEDKIILVAVAGKKI